MLNVVKGGTKNLSVKNYVGGNGKTGDLTNEQSRKKSMDTANGYRNSNTSDTYSSREAGSWFEYQFVRLVCKAINLFYKSNREYES